MKDQWYAGLNSRERAVLAAKLGRATGRLMAEYEALSGTPASVLAGYGIGPRFGVLVSDWLICGVDCAQAQADLHYVTTQAMSRAAGDR
jgi:hypothetical protein